MPHLADICWQKGPACVLRVLPDAFVHCTENRHTVSSVESASRALVMQLYPGVVEVLTASGKPGRQANTCWRYRYR